MSYIRCTSNPEYLYVYSDGRHIHVSHGVRKPHSSGKAFAIPEGTFLRCVRKWEKGWHTRAAFHGMAIEEVYIDRKTAKSMPHRTACPRCKDKTYRRGRLISYCPCTACTKRIWKDTKHGEFKVRLSYKADFVNLWKVTMAYIAANVENR